MDLTVPLTGSYRAEDCRFLLKPLAADYTDIPAKERLIQTGVRHYSEMISRESPPDPQYQTLFAELTARYKTRLAQEILDLAGYLASTRPAPLTVVSLARAGTPIGALLQRALTGLGVASQHYSISIIRDRGIDRNALRYLLGVQQRPAAGLVFVDGWTAKGVITAELKQAIADWNRTESVMLNDELLVVSDIGGTADVAATTDDYVIPSGIMNATVSGLVSRSILNEAIGPDDFHGCVVYDHLRDYDCSQWFLDQISTRFTGLQPRQLTGQDRTARQRATRDCLRRIQHDYQVSDINRIKPGIAEATRVMLRRVPDRLLLRDPAGPDVEHLCWLAAAKQVTIVTDTTMPFNALALIRDVQQTG